ncbi:NAD(P)-dependent oxidoreductase [Serratia ficaria]|uniref:NAD(P)-dependent oxidoreductase n=1 Tax=Serratia ficaria TaxID=61651 RepID=UPI00077C74EE|nr:NAD(P)-dependent oxidoreductase [Serratia ficaria]
MAKILKDGPDSTFEKHLPDAEIIISRPIPLYPSTEGMFNDKLLAEIKRGAYLINTARAQVGRSGRRGARRRVWPHRRPSYWLD